MASLVHLTPERTAGSIIRSGVAARSHGRSGELGVYCMAVLSSFTLTHQWVRELRRWHCTPLLAVDLRIPDDEPVTVGRYDQQPQRLTAAQAIAIVRQVPDPRGFEIFVPRRIFPDEVRRVRHMSQGMGWRYQPDAHGRRPCTCPMCLARGTPGAARLRRRFPSGTP